MADSADVLGNEPQQPTVPSGQGDDKITLSRSEFDSLRRERDEARESERYWSERARGGNGRPAEPQPQEDDGPAASEFLDEDDNKGGGLEGDTPEKLIDEFAASGVAALSKRGFITAKDAQKIAVDTALRVTQELIGRERQKMGTDQTIMNEFPELKDQNSDLFKATAKIYQRAVAMDPNARKSPAALFLAAEAARESLKRTAPARDRDDDDYRPERREREEDRRARAAAQDSRGNGKQDIDEMDMLGPQAKEVAKLMGISEKEFRESRKDLGVRPGRRR